MKIRPYRWAAFLLLCFALSAILFTDPYLPIGSNPWTGGIAYAETVPVIYVNARGKSGTEIGRALADSLKTRFPNVAQKIDAYLAQFVNEIAYETGISAQDLFDSYAVPRINAIKQNIEQRYRDEVNALGSRLGLSDTDELGDGVLSSNELWAAQLLPDIARVTNCSGFGVFGSYSLSGSPIVGRNLDWFTNAALRSIQTITVYVYESTALVNIGFAGFTGVITGYNSNGLFAGILDSPLGDDYPDPPTGKRSYVFDLRDALETCTRIANAAGLLYNKPYAFSHNILFADTTDVQVLEHPQGANGRLRNDESTLSSDLSWGRSKQIAVVNFFALPGYTNERYSYNTYRWNRFKELATFSTMHRAAVNDVESIMLDTNWYPIFNSETVQSMVFTPADRKLYLYAEGITNTVTMEPILISDDADGDGLPDNWEITYFGNLSKGGAADSDGDGYTNLEEYQKRTDPTDPNSYPRYKPMPWLPLLLDD
jgi:hypothetical protein